MQTRVQTRCRIRAHGIVDLDPLHLPQVALNGLPLVLVRESTRSMQMWSWHRLPGHAAVLGTVVARMAPNSQEPTLTLPPTCCSPLLTSAMAAEGCSEFAWPYSQEPTLTLPPSCCSPLLKSAMAAQGCSEFAWPYSQEPTLTLPPRCCSPLLKSAMAAEGCLDVVTSLNSAKYLTSDWWRAGLPPPSPHHNVEECQAVHVFVSRPGPKTA